MFLNVCNASPSVKSGNNWFCHLQSAGCDSWGLFEKVLQTVQTSQISRQLWALSWWMILAFWKFDWCCCWNWCSCFCSATVEVPTKMVFFNWHRCVVTSKLWLTCGARIIVFLKNLHRSSRGCLLEHLSPCRSDKKSPPAVTILEVFRGLESSEKWLKETPISGRKSFRERSL